MARSVPTQASKRRTPPGAAAAARAQALLRVGLEAYRRGDMVEAADRLGAAVGVCPDDARLHCNHAEALRAAGRRVEAEAAARVALTLRPDYPQAWLNLAVVLLEDRRHDQAEAAARAALTNGVPPPPTRALAEAVLADALRGQGRIDEAEAAYRVVLAQIPDDRRVQTNLGLMLFEAGRFEEGLDLCRRAARGPGGGALALENLSLILLRCGRVAEAMELLETAIGADPNSALLSLAIGAAWLEQGQLADARQWLDRALFLDPSLDAARLNLARLEIDADDPEAALAIVERMIEARPDDPAVRLVRARARLEQGDTEGAVQDHRAAVDLKPLSAPLTAALGDVLTTAGDLSGALEAQRRALELDPRSVPALAGVLTLRKGRALETERAAARDLIGKPWITPKAEASLRFALAADADGRADWAEAADQMVRANALRTQADALAGLALDPSAHQTFVDRQIEIYTPELFERLKGLGSASERPVFVVGMPRSGTTLTEQILASHPSTFGAGERPFASMSLNLLARFQGRPQGEATAGVGAASAEQLAACAAWHLERLRRLDDGRSVRVVDKMPDNANLLGWLAVLFPRARFVYCRRDLRDVALSCFITNFKAIRWANDMGAVARRIDQHVRLMRHWAQVLPAPVHVVDYEAMVAEQAGETRRLLHAVGLEWDDRCLNFFAGGRAVRTASVTQVRQPVYTASVARWTHYTDILEPVTKVLQSRPFDG